MTFQTLDFNDEIMGMLNPKSGIVVEPGRKLTYYYPFEVLCAMKNEGTDVFPVKVIVSDEIGHEYRAPISEDLQRMIFG